MAIAADDGTAASTGVVRAIIDRVAMLGFEVRVELTNAATGGPFIAQITRGDAEALGLKAGDTVYVRATRVPPIPEEALAQNDTAADADEAKLGTAASTV
jgi:sulfate transport system ATP-binding protein